MTPSLSDTLLSATLAAPVLVVVPTLNEAAHIEAVLDALLRDAPPFASLRIVVADGGSTDATCALVSRVAAREPRVRLMHNPLRLQSAAVNAAVAQHGAGCDLLIRCDAHGLVPPAFLQRLVESLHRHAADAVVVPMDSIGHTPWQKAVAWVSDSPAGSGGSAHRGGRRSGFVDHGHHAAFRMASFVRAGGYDTSFVANEDAELDCRQRALGSRLYLDADIRLGYLPRSTPGRLWAQYRRYGQGRARTVQRHPGSLRARQLAVPLFMLGAVAALAAGPWWPALWFWPGLYAAALLCVSLQLTGRHRSPIALLAAPAAAVMHAAWALGFIEGLLTRREPRWHAESAQPLALAPQGAPA